MTMIINLCFHGIGTCQLERESGESRYWITQDMFLRTLDLVSERTNVRLSFDDGNISDVLIALPALQERGLTATFFALAGRLHDPASLSPADLRRLSDAGMTIGSHGWSHVPWRGLDAAAAERELIEARAVLADVTSVAVQDAALPLGRYDRRLLNTLREAGYRRVFSSDRFPARPESWLQARYSLTSQDDVASVARLFTMRSLLSSGLNVPKSVIKRFR